MRSSFALFFSTGEHSNDKKLNSLKAKRIFRRKKFIIKIFYLSHSPNKVAQVPRELLLLILKLNS